MHCESEVSDPKTQQNDLAETKYDLDSIAITTRPPKPVINFYKYQLCYQSFDNVNRQSKALMPFQRLMFSLKRSPDTS